MFRARDRSGNEPTGCALSGGWQKRPREALWQPASEAADRRGILTDSPVPAVKRGINRRDVIA